MQDEKARDNSPGIRLLLWTLILLAIPVVVLFRTRPELEPPPQILVPLGTNVAVKGTTYYNPENHKPIGTILDVDPAYDFAGGIVGPGVLVRTVNGAETWVPRENMVRVLVPPPSRQ